MRLLNMLVFAAACAPIPDVPEATGGAGTGATGGDASADASGDAAADGPVADGGACTNGLATCGSETCSVDLESNSAHCGACDHSCEKGTCEKGMCQAYVFATTPGGQGKTTGAFALAITAIDLYFSNEDLDTIRRVDMPDGANPQLAFSGQGRPQGLTLGQGTLFWTNRDDGTIRGSCNSTPLLSGQQAPRDIDYHSPFLYFVNETGGQVRRAEVVSGITCPKLENLTTLFSSPGERPLQVHVGGNKVYFTSFEPVTGAGFLHRVDSEATGTSTDVVMANGSLMPWGVVTDTSFAYVRIGSDAAGGCVARVPLPATGEPLDCWVPSAANQAHGVPRAVALDDEYVYWTSPDTVWRVKKQGETSPTAIFKVIGTVPHDIVSTADAIFFTDYQKSAVYKLVK